MSLLTLSSDASGWLASGRLVYGADEIETLGGAVDALERLGELVRSREAAVREARREGFERGQREGRADGEGAAAEASAAALAALEARYRDEVERQRADCADLALEIVRRVAGEIAPAEWLHALAARAAEELVERAPLTLRVHPERADAVRERVRADAPTPIAEVLGDEELAPGGCVLESRFGKVDVDLDTQLERILALAGGGADDG